MTDTDVLSFDCANKTLAFTHVIVNIDICNELDNLLVNMLSNVRRLLGVDMFCKLAAGEKTEDINITSELLITFLSDWAIILKLLDNFIKVRKSGVVDVLSGLNVDETTNIFRIQCLHDTLVSLNIEVDFNTVVLIEEQPDVRNTKSNEVESAIMMYYTIQGARIMTINPTQKNNINFHHSIHRNVFLAGCNNQYQANKMHSSANFMYIVKLFKLNSMLATLDGSKYDDLADSFMQIMAWLGSRSKK